MEARFLFCFPAEDLLEKSVYFTLLAIGELVKLVKAPVLVRL